MANADFAGIGKGLADHFFGTFDNIGTRPNLQTLYKDTSLSTIDGKQTMGMQAVMTAKMEMGERQHRMTTCDSQPCGTGVLTAIAGDLAVAGAPGKFSQTFVLMPTPEGGWFIANDIFRTAGNATCPPPNPADKSDVGKAFADHYYQTFDTARANLQTLYRDNSLLTFEDSQFMGVAPIMTKLTTLQFTTVQHVITTCDCHPLGEQILVVVQGDLAVDGEVTKPLKFTQTFVLAPEGASWFINHDIFRFNIG